MPALLDRYAAKSMVSKGAQKYDDAAPELEELARRLILSAGHRKYWPVSWRGGQKWRARGGPVHQPNEGAIWLLAGQIAAEARGKPDPAGWVRWVTKKRLLDAQGDRELEGIQGDAWGGYDGRHRPRHIGMPPTDAGADDHGNDSGSRFGADTADEEARNEVGREYGSKKPDRVYPLCASPFSTPHRVFLAGLLRALVAGEQSAYSMPTVRKHLKAAAEGGDVQWLRNYIDPPRWSEPGGRAYLTPWHWQPDGPKGRPYSGRYTESAEQGPVWQSSPVRDAAYELGALGAVLDPATFEPRELGTPKWREVQRPDWLYGCIRQREGAGERRELSKGDRGEPVDGQALRFD